MCSLQEAAAAAPGTVLAAGAKAHGVTRLPRAGFLFLFVAAWVSVAQGEDELPPDSPYFKPTYPPGYRVPAFEECGGKGKEQLKCEKGCWCAQKDENSYHKECTPPKGYSTCSAKRAQQFLKIAKEKFDEWDEKAEKAKKVEEEANAVAKQWLKKAVEAKKASKEANETYAKIKVDASQNEAMQVNKATQEAKTSIANIQTVTKEAYVKQAKTYQECNRKIEEAQKTFDEEQEDFEKSKKEANDARQKVQDDADAKVQNVTDTLDRLKEEAPKKVAEAVSKENKAAHAAAAAYHKAHNNAKKAQEAHNEASTAATAAADEAASVHAKIKVWADTLQ